MQNYEFGAGLWMFQQFVDRYATDAYGPPVDTLAAIERAASVGDIKYLDINYPFAGDGVTVEQVRETLQRTGVRAYAITPHLYMREFQMGSFTSPDPALRRKAIDLGKQAVEIAHQLGARYVKFWPGQDGFDYPFQVDYRHLWDRSVEGVRAVAESDPSMQFAIEYKAKEPRVHMFFNSAARTLLAIEDMGVDNVGILLDLGHSLYAKEIPAEVVQLVSRRGKLVSVEVNDNWRDWDDDMAVGSVHLIETLEFLYALRQVNWQKPILLDQFPFREDPIKAAQSSINTLRALDSLLDRIDLNALAAAQDRQDALEAQRIVMDMLLGAGVAGVGGVTGGLKMIDTQQVDIQQVDKLRSLASSVRRRDLQTVHNANLGHVGGEMSATDILVTLYFAVLHVDPEQPNDPDRDRFILSKGHSAVALYTTLAHRGFFPMEELDTFAQPLSKLNGHPDRNKVPGVETNTGPLGHGLPVAVGAAIAAKLQDAAWRVFALTGDGELQEGSNWEAAMSAAHYKLDNLTVIVDRNRLQQGDWTEQTMHLEPLADKWRAFGWSVVEVDGHSIFQLLQTFSRLPFEPGRPNCIIAHTHKGQGVSFMRDRAAWHHKVPSAEELAKALKELEEVG